MCGIAGIIDSPGGESGRHQRLGRMLDAVRHRGPDFRGVHLRDNVAVGCQRLQIVGKQIASQPVRNEDHSVIAVVNGEFFDHQEVRRELNQRGHRWHCDADSEILVHLWEEHGIELLSRIRGQFAFALVDFRQRVIMLARDRTGICPLFWTLQSGRFAFCSEIKGILAALDTLPGPDIFGIDQLFSFFSLPAARTCFEHISAVPPGCRMTLNFNPLPGDPRVSRYWDISFPDCGDEFDASEQRVVDEFGEVFDRSVRRRLAAETPLVTYLSGGVDSTIVRHRANHWSQSVLPCYSANVTASRLHRDGVFSEGAAARESASHTGMQQTVVECPPELLVHVYPDLLRAAESPVIDLAATASYRLAGHVHADGFKVVLSGEGADEALAGYFWHKGNQVMNLLDTSRYRTSNVLRYLYVKARRLGIPWSRSAEIQAVCGGPYGQLDMFGFLSSARYLFYSASLLERLGDYLPHRELDINRSGLKALASPEPVAVFQLQNHAARDVVKSQNGPPRHAARCGIPFPVSGRGRHLPVCPAASPLETATFPG